MIYCQRIAIWGLDGHIMSYVFMYSLVNTSGMYYLRLNWDGILCTLKIPIIVSCISFQQLEPLKYDINILLINFFPQFLFFLKWLAFIWYTRVKSSAYSGSVYVFCLYVSVCVGYVLDWMRERMCVCVCVCVRARAHTHMCSCSCNVN